MQAPRVHTGRVLTGALLVAVALALLAPAASAHTAIFSTDGKVRGSIGLLNEAVVTYSKTGLDACFTENVTVVAPATRPPVAVNPGNLTATLRAPNGQTLTMGLAAQFGRTGCVSFTEPLVLTQPGQYLMDISGSVNGSLISSTGVLAGGAVEDLGNVTFPDATIKTNIELQATIDSLTAQLTALQGRLVAVETAQAEHESAAKDSDGRFAPGAPTALIIVGLAALVAARRVR